MGVTEVFWGLATLTAIWVCWGDGKVWGASPPGLLPPPAPHQQHHPFSRGRGQQVVRVKRKAADSTQLWPDAVVPYAFLSPEPQREVVLAGLKHWEERTCLRFLPAKNKELPHLQFRKLSGCRSGVGIEGAAGQNISIGDNCNKVGIVVHEVGHAVGLYHEIRRPDRDTHVVVNEANILPHEMYNFYKLHWLDVTVEYDLSSVMHYHTLEWSANGRTTVATKDPMLQGVLGGWKRASTLGLSHRDAFLANHIYGCLNEWLAKCGLKRNPCRNDGYLGSSCTCVCPPGTEGRTCGTVRGGYYKHLKSPCSQQVTHPTTLTSPNYPAKYDPDTWCVYRVEAPQCQAPEVTVLDLQLGPRDHRNHCYTDYLEVRNASLYDGFLVCGSEVTPGTVWRAQSSTLILYFRGETGGFRGFRASVAFRSIPGCCRSHSNISSTFYLHSPGYPAPATEPFSCSFSLPAESPAKVVVTIKLVWGKGGRRAAAPHPACALTLCQPHGHCHSFCRMVEASRRRRRRRRKRRKRREEEEEEDGEDEEEEDGEDVEGKVVLPNVGSLHLLQAPLSLHLAGSGAALQVAFTLQHSPCHESLFVNRSDPRGWVAVGAGAGEVMQCEWLITAPRGTHVKVTVERLNLPDEENDEDEENGGETRGYNNTAEGDERQKNNIQTDEKEETFEQEGKGRGRGKHKSTLESYLCVNEAGDASFPSASTRVLQGGGRRTVPLVFVSLQHSLRIAFQGAANTSLRLRYQLYECEDDNSECQYWAAEGECVANPRWMAPHCRRACQQCDFSTTCEDQHSNCAFWSTHNQCEENKLWMAVHCSRSCGYCDVCGDSNRRCGRWAREGECEANGEYMRVFCPLSCGVCEPTNTTTTSTTTTPAPPTTTTTTTTIIPRPSTRRRGGGKKRVSQVYEDNETTGGISRHPKIRKNGKRLKNPRLFKPGRTKTRKTGRRVTENSLLVTHTSPRGQENENRGLKSKESKDNKGDSSILVPRKKTETSRREENEEDEEERKNEEAEEEVKENHEEKENEGKEGEEEEKSNEEMEIEEEDIRNREEKENDQNKELKEIKGEEEEEETKERQEIEKEINREEKEEDNKNEEEMREAEDTSVHSSTQLSYSDQNSLTSGNEDIHLVVLKKDGKYLKNLFRNQQKGNEGTREGVEENEVTERKATTERTRENGIIAGKRENEILRGNGEGSEGIEESGINLRERKEMQITEEKEGRKRRKINNWRRRRRRNRRKNQRRKGREWRDGGNDPQTRRRKEGKYQGGGRRGEGRRWRKSRRGKKGRKTGDRRREDERDFYVTASPATTTTTTTISTSILTLPPPASTHSTPIPSQIISTSPKLGTRTHHKHSHRRYRNRFHRHHRDRHGKTPSPKGRRGPKPHSGTPKTPPGNVETQQEANEIREAGKNTSETSQKTEIPDWVTVGFSRNDVQESEGVFQVTPRSRSDLGRSGSERGRGVNEWRRSERGHDGEKRRDEKGQLGNGTERRTAEDIRQNVERSYAEWGIGPTRPVHRPRLSPSWRFRKGFYRRGKHVYEDDHP